MGLADHKSTMLSVGLWLRTTIAKVSNPWIPNFTMTSWLGNPFRVTDPLWGESTSQKQVMQALDVFVVVGGVRPRDVNMPSLWWHYSDVMMSAKASQITAVTIVYWTMCSYVDQRKHQSSASLALGRGITGHRWIPRTKGQQRGKCFHLMTSSWNVVIPLIYFRILSQLWINGFI